MTDKQQDIEITLSRDEVLFLIMLVEERIAGARKQGIPDSHESSIFREKLQDKLSDTVHLV